MLKVPARELLVLLVLALMWSLSFTVIKVGVEYVPPVTLAALRIIIGAIVLWAWMRLRGGRLHFNARLWWMFFLIGVFGNVFPFILINWGEMRISSGLAATLISLMPLSALLLGSIFSDEILNLRRILGIFLGLGGVVVLIGPQELLALGDDIFPQLAVTVGAVCYAIAGILIRKLPSGNRMENGAGILISASIIMIPASLLVDAPWTIEYNWSAILSSLYLGIFPTAIATILLIEVIAKRGVTFLSLNNYLIPAMGVLWGVLFLDEKTTPSILIGLVVILTGIAMAGSGPATKKDEIENS
ncbi:MAG: DMT family transporter [Rhodospirillaceae bacterium]|nr:DMT family transporter [Rhodospirillaceae bacterium]